MRDNNGTHTHRNFKSCLLRSLTAQKLATTTARMWQPNKNHVSHFFLGAVLATDAASNLNGVYRLPEEKTKMRDGGLRRKGRKQWAGEGRWKRKRGMWRRIKKVLTGICGAAMDILRVSHMRRFHSRPSALLSNTINTFLPSGNKTCCCSSIPILNNCSLTVNPSWV